MSMPPFDDDAFYPSLPFLATRMQSFFDWKTKSMREVYSSACVPIFSAGSGW